MNHKGQRRYAELDIMKGIGIFLIVLGHLEPGTYLMRFLYSFHLFLFFFCAGFVGVRYNNRRFVEIVKANAKRLLIPYMLWTVLSQAVDLAMGAIGFPQAVKNVFFLDANVGWNAALWFLISLFWADTFCGLIVKLNKVVQIVFCIVMIGCWIAISSFHVVLPIGLYTVPAAAVFWLLGYWSNSFEWLEKLKAAKRPIKVLIGICAFLINIVVGTLFHSVISLYHIQFQSIPKTIIAGAAGVLFVLVISVEGIKYTRIAGIIKTYGKNSLTILCTHYFVLRIIGEVTYRTIRYNLWRYTSTIKSIAFAAVIIIAYYPILLLLVRLKKKHTWLKYIV